MGRRARPKPKSTKPPKAVWQAAFIAALSESSNVTAAAKVANIDKTSVYKARRQEADFNRRWQEALAEGYDNLEMDLLHRLRTGHLEGGKVQARRKYDNAIAFRLLTAHREAVGRHKALRAVEDEDEIIASINAKIELMKERRAALRCDEDKDKDEDEAGTRDDASAR